MFWPPFQGDRGGAALVVSADAHVTSLVADSLDAVDVRVVHPAPGFESLRRAVLDEPPGRLALVDLAATGRRGPHLIRALRTLGWSSVLAVVPRHHKEARAAVVDAGVDGVLVRPDAHLAGGGWAGRVLSGDLCPGDLTAREVEVIRLVAAGCTNRGAAGQLGLSPMTVKSHLERIGRKLGTGDRAAMVLQALRRGVIW
ncbi:LuxR C-terminal-related transcriptional regulator [Lentzea sp. HUAS12]|uniref:helix-turn-helix transcriptional regulator n=1 Tax=Lentzea sp. HUAS12 TaxID=2951806 RepID=UPI00209EC052|nr:LuxR C-terminal-related transcriptional regulator [Lentzea sp. HUAS12]